MIDDLRRRALKRRSELDVKQGEAQVLVASVRSLREETATLATDVSVLDQVTHLLNRIGEEKQFEAQAQIEELVTRGLQTIFDESLSFHILQTVRGRTAQVEFVVRTTRGDLILDTPVMDARGGGVGATIGFLLRVVVMLLSGDLRQERILLLDETFSMVSDEYLVPLAEFVRSITEETGIQILMVTHQKIWEDVADRLYRFTQKDGRTVAVAVSS